MRPHRIHLAILAGALLLAGALQLVGCATLSQVAALTRVGFAFDRVSDVRVAGIDVGRFVSYGDLGAVDVARFAAAVLDKEVPLDMIVHVRAQNPADNDVTARLVGMDWTLFVRDREAVSGSHPEDLLLPPGEPVDLPLATSIELTRLGDGRARDLFDLAVAIAGHGSTTVPIRLEMLPSIDTPAGKMRYPQPIVIERGGPEVR